MSSRIFAVLFAVLILLTNKSVHASGVVLGSYLDLSNAEKAAVAARSVLQDLGKTNEVRVIDGKTSAFQKLSRVVILSADEKDARVLLQDIRFSYPDAWFLVDVPGQGIVRQKALAASESQEATSLLRASQDQQKKCFWISSDKRSSDSGDAQDKFRPSDGDWSRGRRGPSPSADRYL